MFGDVERNVGSALVLCECIEDWQNETALLGVSIKKFDWNAISRKLACKGTNMSSDECCTMWAYIAHGKTISAVTNYASDDEPTYYQPLTALKRYKHDESNPHSWITNKSTDASVLGHHHPGPDVDTVRDGFKKIKFLVPEQIHTGASNLHPMVFSNEKVFNQLLDVVHLPAPLVSTIAQANPHYQAYREKKLFCRQPYLHYKPQIAVPTTAEPSKPFAQQTPQEQQQTIMQQQQRALQLSQSYQTQALQLRMRQQRESTELQAQMAIKAKTQQAAALKAQQEQAQRLKPVTSYVSATQPPRPLPSAMHPGGQGHTMHGPPRPLPPATPTSRFITGTGASSVASSSSSSGGASITTASGNTSTNSGGNNNALLNTGYRPSVSAQQSAGGQHFRSNHYQQQMPQPARGPVVTHNLIQNAQLAAGVQKRVNLPTQYVYARPVVPAAVPLRPQMGSTFPASHGTFSAPLPAAATNPTASAVVPSAAELAGDGNAQPLCPAQQQQQAPAMNPPHVGAGGMPPQQQQPSYHHQMQHQHAQSTAAAAMSVNGPPIVGGIVGQKRPAENVDEAQSSSSGNYVEP